MSRNVQPPGIPGTWQLSPWAQRFGWYDGQYAEGPSDLFKEFNAAGNGGILHSGLNPVYPALDPKWYGDAPPVPERQWRENDPIELNVDYLRMSELMQVYNLWNLQSWELAVLNKFVYFGPNYGVVNTGHNRFANMWIPNLASRVMLATNMPGVLVDEELLAQKIFELESVQVNENNWYPFLRKDRWWNNENTEWHVDDDNVWNALRPGLELADRMLKAAINDQHTSFQTLLFGRVDYYDRVRPRYTGDLDLPQTAPNPGDKILLSLAAERQLAGPGPCDGEYMVPLNVNDWNQTLTGLLRRHTWFLHAPKRVNTTEYDYRWLDFGMTYAVELTNGVHTTAAALNAALIVPFFRKLDISLSERCFQVFQLAITIIHELGHAIFYNRCGSAGQGNHLDPQDVHTDHDDPIIDWEAQWQPETGYWLEHALFGDAIDSNMLSHESNIAMTIYDTSHGRPAYTGNDGGIHLSSLYASRMVSQRFWEPTRLPLRKSDRFFHKVKDFRLTEDWPYAQPRRLPLPADYDPEREFLKPHHKARKDMWESFRFRWYRFADDRWRESQWGMGRVPWGDREEDFELRMMLARIAPSYRKRDIITLKDIADTLCWRMPWDQTEQFLPHMPNRERGDYEDAAFPGYNWYWHCLGLLLMAAMPLVGQGLDRDPHSWPKVLTSSREAQRQGNPLGQQLQHSTTYVHEPEGCERNVFYDTLGMLGLEVAFGNFSALDYCTSVERTIEQIATFKALIEMRWFESLRTTLYHIWEYRRTNNDPTSWVPDWPFQAPVYSEPQQWAWWDSDNSQWLRVSLEDYYEEMFRNRQER